MLFLPHFPVLGVVTSAAANPIRRGVVGMKEAWVGGSARGQKDAGGRERPEFGSKVLGKP